MRRRLKISTFLTGAALFFGGLLFCGAGIYGNVMIAAAKTNVQESPKLPLSGGGLSDFVPFGWTLMDSVALDSNGDGTEDYVGVIEHDAAGEEDSQDFYPRILFAVASGGEEGYQLDFQDEYLIRTESEGGPFGDPYEPLTAEGNSFTTHSYGGSSWKWSEAYTYARRDGTWYLMKAVITDSFGPYICNQSTDDYGAGIGMRSVRSSEFEDIEKWEEGGSVDTGYDLVYYVPLDPPPTLYQAGMRRSLDQMKECQVDTVAVADGIDLEKEAVTLPQKGYEYYGGYRDEDCLLYKFMAQDNNKAYLAMYREKDRSLSVVAEETGDIDFPVLYQDKIYYISPVLETVSYLDSQGSVTQSVENIGGAICRINLDGTDRREIFRYELPEIDKGVLPQSCPFVWLSYEISGGEIVTEVHIGGRPHPFYRISLAGGQAQLIGTVPGGGEN